MAARPRRADHVAIDVDVPGAHARATRRTVQSMRCGCRTSVRSLCALIASTSASRSRGRYSARTCTIGPNNSRSSGMSRSARPAARRTRRPRRSRQLDAVVPARSLHDVAACFSSIASASSVDDGTRRRFRATPGRRSPVLPCNRRSSRFTSARCLPAAQHTQCRAALTGAVEAPTAPRRARPAPASAELSTIIAF